MEAVLFSETRRNIPDNTTLHTAAQDIEICDDDDVSQLCGGGVVTLSLPGYQQTGGPAAGLVMSRGFCASCVPWIRN
jgi:hypothetical protein